MIALGARVLLRREFLRELARRDEVRGEVKGVCSGVCEGTMVVREDNGDWHVRQADNWEVVK